MAVEQAAVEALLQKHPLEKDGIVEELYNYLWQKDPSRDNEGLRAYIPDTVVFRNRVVSNWYFTSRGGRDAGMVKRKAKASISNESIEEAFVRKTPEEFDVVAVYIENPENAEGARLVGATAVIEYLNQRQLHDLLHKRRKGVSAVLQKFLEPKGGYNNVIRAIWSPHALHTERRTALKQLYDTRLDMLERCVTYDGPIHFSAVSQVMGQVLPRALTALCEDIVEHITSVTFARARVARMVLNLKVGSDGHLYLLSCSSMRLDDSDIVTRAKALREAAMPAEVGPLANIFKAPPRSPCRGLHCPPPAPRRKPKLR